MKDVIKGFAIGVVFSLALILIISNAMATSIPCPILLEIKTIPESAATGLHVELRDGSRIVQRYIVNEYHEAAFDVGGIAECKEYTAVIVECQDKPSCSKKVHTGEIIVWDVLADVPATTTTTLPVPDLFNEGVAVTVSIFSILFGVAGASFFIKDALILRLKNGWGVRIYKSRDGKSVKLYHKHPGIVAYHDPNTLHRNEEIRHKRGIIFG